MFERYTEQARQILFFARYETSQLGHFSIETEHLVLALLRVNKGIAGGIFERHHIAAGGRSQGHREPAGVPGKAAVIG